MTDSVVVRHPVRGLLWGLVFGLGLAFVLVFTTIIVFARLPVLTTIAIGTAAGLIWSVIGPPRTPKSPPPEPGAATRVEPPE
jgi:hypothetical protein